VLSNKGDTGNGVEAVNYRAKQTKDLKNGFVTIEGSVLWLFDGIELGTTDELIKLK
jgi:hypothetical protein